MEVWRKKSVDWDDLALRVGQALLFKAHAGYCNEMYEGPSEQDIVSTVGKIFEASGYDTYYEEPYPGDHGRKKCDVTGYSWRGEKVFCEVKIVYGGKDKRLNAHRFNNKGELVGDFGKLGEIDGNADRIFLMVVLSGEPEDFFSNCDHTACIGLQDLVEHLNKAAESAISNKLEKEGKHLNVQPTHFIFFFLEEGAKVVGTVEEGKRYLHVLSWWM